MRTLKIRKEDNKEHAEFSYQFLKQSAIYTKTLTRRPASADRTARGQFQATGQPMSRTQARDVMM